MVVIGMVLIAALVAGALVLLSDADRDGAMPDVELAERTTYGPLPGLTGTRRNAPAKDGQAVDDCEWEHQPKLASDETSRRSIEAAVDTLTTSSDPDLLFGAALLAKGMAQFEDTEEWDEEALLLNRARAIAPEHRALTWHTLNDCANRTCDRVAVETDAIRVDGDNGHVWLQIASTSIGEDRWEDMEAAFERAASAPRFDTYFMDFAVAIEQALGASSDLSYVDRITVGIGHAAAIALPYLGAVAEVCAADGVPASISTDVCDDLGRQMTASGRDILTVAIGYELRRMAAERDGNSARATRFSREKKAMNDEWVDALTNADGYALLANDPAVLQRYVENFLVHGEMRAIDLVVVEAQRLKADPTYDQCNFVQRPYEPS